MLPTDGHLLARSDEIITERLDEWLPGVLGIASPPSATSTAAPRPWHNGDVQISARVDYAIRAMLELAAAHPDRLSRDELARRQQLPPRYLEAILRDLARDRLIAGHRGVTGGYELARRSDAITVADVARAVDGPLALVVQQRPEHVAYTGPSEHLADLWVGLRAAIRSVMDHVTLADLLAGRLPPDIRELLDDAEAWRSR